MIANNTQDQQPHHHHNTQGHSELHQIQRYKSFTYLFCMVMVYCLGMFYFGYCLTYLGSFNFKDIMIIFQIQMEQSLAYGLLQGCVPIGGGIGALLSYPLLRYFSRRKCLLIISVIALVINCIIFVPNFGLLFFCRIVQGICVGLYSTITPLIIKEIVPYETSGTFGAFNQMFISLGIVFAFLVQYLVIVGMQNQGGDIRELWRVQFGFPILTVLFQTLMVIFVYDFETPKYLLHQGRQDDCRKLLEKIYKQEYVNEVLKQKKIDLGLKLENNQELSQQNVNENDKNRVQTFQKEGEDEKAQNKMEDQKKQELKREEELPGQTVSERIDLLKPTHKAGIRRFLSMDLSILQQFIGTTAIESYGVLIMAEVFPELANVIPIILNLVPVLVIMLTSCMLAKIGRKTLLQVGTMIEIISLIIVCIGYFLDSSEGRTMIIVGLFLWMVGFGLSLGPIVWIYIAQIVQPDFIPFPTTVNWFMAALVAILFPILLQAFGSAGPIFAFFAGYTLLFFFINQKCILETKDKTETEIYQQFDDTF